MSPTFVVALARWVVSFVDAFDDVAPRSDAPVLVVDPELALAVHGRGIVNFVVARRLEKWPDGESRAEAARMLGDGVPLTDVLRRYPECVPNVARDKPVEPARRAIYAHYALLQELQGTPDVDPKDSATVEEIIRKQGIEWGTHTHWQRSDALPKRLAGPALVPQPDAGALDRGI
jgi:hypothetical protein